MRTFTALCIRTRNIWYCLLFLQLWNRCLELLNVGNNDARLSTKPKNIGLLYLLLTLSKCYVLNVILIFLISVVIISISIIYHFTFIIIVFIIISCSVYWLLTMPVTKILYCLLFTPIYWFCQWLWPNMLCIVAGLIYLNDILYEIWYWLVIQLLCSTLIVIVICM